MAKKAFLLVILFVFIFLASGCTIAKGAGGAVIGCGQGASEGFKDDMGFVKNADSWIRDNLW